MACMPCFAHGWMNSEDDDLCVFGEVGGGLVFGGKRYPLTFGENSLGYNGYIELRYRLSNPHFDVGLYGGYGEFKRKNNAGFSKVFDTLDVLFTINYNLFRSGKIRPFIGVGAGVVNDSAVDFLTSMVLPDEYLVIGFMEMNIIAVGMTLLLVLCSVPVYNLALCSVSQEDISLLTVSRVMRF